MKDNENKPERLKSFKFQKRNKVTPREEWDRLLDGGIWRVPLGGLHANSIRQRFWEAARARGLKVRTQTDGDYLVIQAYKP